MAVGWFGRRGRQREIATAYQKLERSFLSRNQRSHREPPVASLTAVRPACAHAAVPLVGWAYRTVIYDINNSKNGKPSVLARPGLAVIGG